MNFAPPAIPPVGFPAIQSPTGLQVGDLILLNNTTGYAVGEITGIAPAAARQHECHVRQRRPAEHQSEWGSEGKYQIHHRRRQSGGDADMGDHVFHGSSGRPPLADTAPDAPGQRAIPSPVSDNIIGFTVTYDVCDGTIVVGCSGIPSPLVAPFSPTQVHKVNIQIMAQTLTSYGNKSRSSVLATSVSTRSLSFKDRYQ